MKNLKYISIIVLFVLFTSFNKTESKSSEYLFQKWVFENFKSDKVTYESKRKFHKHKPGIEFKENGIISKKQNSSWCGTEIEYETVSGTWKKISDSLLAIEYENWNGKNKDTLQIVKLTKSKLIIKYSNTLKTD